MALNTGCPRKTPLSSHKHRSFAPACPLRQSHRRPRLDARQDHESLQTWARVKSQKPHHVRVEGRHLVWHFFELIRTLHRQGGRLMMTAVPPMTTTAAVIRSSSYGNIQKRNKPISLSSPGNERPTCPFLRLTDGARTIGRVTGPLNTTYEELRPAVHFRRANLPSQSLEIHSTDGRGFSRIEGNDHSFAAQGVMSSVPSTFSRRKTRS